MTHHTDAEQERASLGAFIDRAGRDGFDTAHTFFDCGGVVFFNPDTADLWGFWQAARRDPAVQPMPLEQAAASMRATQAQPARIIAASCSCVPAAVEGATYREKLDAELGRTAMRFVDRAGDVHPGIDDADQICREFHEAMSAVINQMPHVQMMRAAAPQPPEADHIPDAGKMDTNVRNWMNAALSKDVACPACGLSGLHACPSASTAESQGADAVKALEKVLRAVQRHLPPERIGERETIAEIISIVDPWPLAKPPANET